MSSDLAQWEVLLSDPTVAVVTLHGASDPLQEEVPLRRQLRHRVRDLIAMQQLGRTKCGEPGGDSEVFGGDQVRMM